MTRERISGVDTAWLRMEHPTNLMMIVGVMIFDKPLSLEAVKRTVRTRFLAFPRFRQKAVQHASGAWWETDSDFDIGAHVHRVALPGKADKAELSALASDLASTPLDYTKPLWQFHLVDRYLGGSALILRIHHCYADGIALTEVMLSMAAPSAAASLTVPEAAEEAPVPARGEQDLWEQIVGPLAGALDGAAKIGRGLLEQGRALAADPQLANEAVLSATRKGADFAGEVARIALMGPDSATRFRGTLGVRKVAVWADPLPLDDVKAMGKALGCSINDVLLSMASGALRDYLEEHGDPVEGISIRGAVPVNLRPPGEARKLGNRFGIVFLELPVGMDHPLERLYEVRRRMSDLKGSYQPLLTLGLLQAVGIAPRSVQDQVLSALGQSATVVMTNVPGPQYPLYFAGRHITELDFWVPQSGGVGMGISILSYDGRIQFGVITDAGLVPDPQAIVGRFRDEFEKLMWLTLMSPWEAQDKPASKASHPREPAPGPASSRRAKAARARGAGPAQAATGAKIPKRFRNL